ncbi:MAG: DUF1015 family protein [Acetobacter sp.]|nr:DUF1015 family protein [Acetobacter sp.]
MTFDDLIYAPFYGIVPTAETADEVIAPPYDVLSSTEAKQKAQNKPFSFLHISKAEIDFDEDVSPYEDRVYIKAAENFRHLLEGGILKKSAKPCFYVYQMQMGAHIQTGLVVAASVEAYNNGRIKRHELTRVAKENDRVKQIRAVGAQTGPALLINKNLPEIKTFLAKVVTERTPLFSAVGDYDVRHTLWEISERAELDFIARAFAEQNEAYIADGHHRSAAASRLAAENGTSNTERFLAVAFFEDEMRIWDYNRVVFDLNGLDETQFITAIKASGFELKAAERRKPAHKGQFMMYLNHNWYEMTYTGSPLGNDPVSQLDVSILSAKVLDNILGIKDLRNDERIDFIGGIRGAEEIERVVDIAPHRVGFMVYPTAVSELLAVADQKMLMPPKSTWFEPKLADGLVSKAC